MAALFAQLGSIFYFIVLPMLLLIGIGFGLQRWLGLDMPTLVRLNFYFIVPGIIYTKLIESELTGGMVGTVVGFQLLQMMTLFGLVVLVGRLRGVAQDQRNAMAMATIFYNSGNYGLPLQGLAWEPQGRGGDAVGMQTFVMVTQNITSFTFGILLASGGRTDESLRAKLMHVLRFPPIYALIAAGLTIGLRDQVLNGDSTLITAVEPFWKTATLVGDAFIAIALCTLGAQLALVKRGENERYPVKLTVFLRLLIAPVIGLGLILLLGIEGFVGQVLLISTATPTAVNAMLLCVEFDNHPDYLARSVFYSTLLSPITVTLTIFLAQESSLFG